MRIKYSFIMLSRRSLFMCHLSKEGVIGALLAISRGKNDKKVKNHWSMSGKM